MSDAAAEEGEAQAAADAGELAADAPAAAAADAPATATMGSADGGDGAADAAGQAPDMAKAAADLVDEKAGDNGGRAERDEEGHHRLCWLIGITGSLVADPGLSPEFDEQIFGADLPNALAAFYRANPDAPAEAGAIHVRRTLGRELLPGADPRRVKLALTLFKLALIGNDAIVKADADAAAEAAKAAEAAANRRPVDPQKLAYRPRKGRAELSSLGKAAKARG